MKKPIWLPIDKCVPVMSGFYIAYYKNPADIKIIWLVAEYLPRVNNSFTHFHVVGYDGLIAAHEARDAMRLA